MGFNRAMTNPEPPRRRPQPYGRPQQQPFGQAQQPEGQPLYHPQQPNGQPQQPNGQPQQQDGQFGYPAASDVRRRTSIPWSGWVLLGAGALMLVGSVSPWATVDILGGIAVNGTDGDGVFTLVFAIVIAMMGVLIGVGNGRLWTSVVALIFAGLAAFTAVVDIGNISSVYDGHADVSSDAISVGFGLWLVAVAAGIGVVFSVLAMVRRS
jgi:hypothetical protein